MYLLNRSVITKLVLLSNIGFGCLSRVYLRFVKKYIGESIKHVEIALLSPPSTPPPSSLLQQMLYEIS